MGSGGGYKVGGEKSLYVSRVADITKFPSLEGLGGWELA